MPKRKSTEELTVQKARRVIVASEGDTEPTPSQSVISQVMAEMGRKGGRIGGKRRLETLSDRRRSQIAREAAQARWAKRKKGPSA